MDSATQQASVSDCGDGTRVSVLQIIEATTGGTGRHLVDLVTGLDRDRFDVSLLCSTLRDPLFLGDCERMKAQGVEVYVVPMVRSISPLKDLCALAAIRRHLRQHRPSIVHTHSSKAGFLGRIAAAMERVPCVVHSPHVFPFEMAVGPVTRRFYLALERFAARFTDRIVCVCAQEREAGERLGLADPGVFAVIENGVTLPDPVRCTEDRDRVRADWGVAPGTVVIGMVSRFTRQKGHRHLLGAARRIVDRFPEVRFVLVGDGELRAEMDALIVQLSLGDHVTVIDSRADVSAFYPAFDVFAFTSLWEGLPYALLEAMAAERPVVATAVGGVTEVLKSGEHGLLVPARDDDALVAALLDLLEHPERRKQLGSAARALVASRYRVETMVERIASLYDTALDFRP